VDSNDEVEKEGKNAPSPILYAWSPLPCCDATKGAISKKADTREECYWIARMLSSKPIRGRHGIKNSIPK
jgi:hypothetical protein